MSVDLQKELLVGNFEIFQYVSYWAVTGVIHHKRNIVSFSITLMLNIILVCFGACRTINFFSAISSCFIGNVITILLIRYSEYIAGLASPNHDVSKWAAKQEQKVCEELYGVVIYTVQRKWIMVYLPAFFKVSFRRVILMKDICRAGKDGNNKKGVLY